MRSTACGTGLPNLHVTLRPGAISPVRPTALFSSSNREPRVHRRPWELGRLQTALLSRKARERGPDPVFQVSHRSRQQKRIYRHHFFSHSIGQDEYHYIDAYISNLAQIRRAAQIIAKFAETYKKRGSLQSVPLNEPERLPTEEEVSCILSYADFLGRALQQQRYSCPRSCSSLCRHSL